MKCYNHPTEDAIAQCGGCGKGLCAECAKKWTPPTCDDCVKSNLGAELDSINHEIILYVVLAVVGTVLGFIMGSSFSRGEANPFIATFSVAIMYAFAFPVYAAGWKWMNHLTDKIALFGTPAFWLIYLFIKLMCSAAVGVFALPYRLYYINKRKKELRAMLSYT